MPQEILRDVLRTGDTVQRTRRRLSILPLSIAAHAAAATLFVIMPLAAEVELPHVRTPFEGDYIKTITPPSPPPVRQASNTPQADLTVAPIKAAEGFAPEPDLPRVPVGEFVDGALDVGGTGSGPGVLIAPGPPSPPPAVEAPQPKIARPGFQGIREPKRIAYMAPEYPEIARISRVEGTVILEAVLDVTGRVHSVRVLKSKALLDEAAIRAVRQWRYTPTELNGVPVQVLMTITVNFQLAR
jgi:protein TonB